METELGVENIKKSLEFAITIQKWLSESLEDGEIKFGEVISLAPKLLKAPGAVEAIKKLPAEVADLTQEEALDVHQYIQEKFDLADDDVEEIVEDCILWLLNTYQLGGRIVKKIKLGKSKREAEA